MAFFQRVEDGRRWRNGAAASSVATGGRVGGAHQIVAQFAEQPRVGPDAGRAGVDINSSTQGGSGGQVTQNHG